MRKRLSEKDWLNWLQLHADDDAYDAMFDVPNRARVEVESRRRRDIIE